MCSQRSFRLFHVGSAVRELSARTQGRVPGSWHSVSRRAARRLAGPLIPLERERPAYSLKIFGSCLQYSRSGLLFMEAQFPRSSMPERAEGVPSRITFPPAR